MTPQEFYNQTYGKAYDIDGAYGFQCYDGMAKFCKDVNIPLSVIYCAKTGYVQDIWELRNTSGILNYFDEVQTGNFKNGDWVIWSRSYNMTPKSHVAMYWNGKAYGQSQNGIKQFNLATLDFNKAMGGFRYKGWSDSKMDLKDGLQSIVYQNKTLKVFKGYGDYKNMYMLSAVGNDTSKAVQDITKFDHNNMVIGAMTNCDYFEMSSKSEYGQHYGVEQSDGDGVYSVSLDLAPKNEGYEVVYQLKDGTVGRCTANDYWYAKKDVIFACTPYATIVLDGKACNYKSSAFGNKDTTANSQTMIMRIGDAWCIACTVSKTLPSVMQAFAIECGADVAFLVDSGGSTQMLATSTGKDWTKVIYTGRAIPNVLVLAKLKSESSTTDEPKDEPTDSETVSKDLYDKVVAERDDAIKERDSYKEKIDAIKKLVD